MKISIMRKPDGKLAWVLFRYDYSLCKCCILSIGCVMIEWLSKECRKGNIQ